MKNILLKVIFLLMCI